MIKEFRNISYVISAVLILQTFTFFTFFFNDPLANGANAVTVTQFVSEFAWVILAVVPPIVLSINRWNSFSQITFFIAAIFWPISLVLLRIFLTIQFGDPYIGYLFTYPIFIFSDIVVPVIYVVFWLKLNNDTEVDDETKVLDKMRYQDQVFESGN